MSNLSPRALALYQAHGPGPVDWERLVEVVDRIVEMAQPGWLPIETAPKEPMEYGEGPTIMLYGGFIDGITKLPSVRTGHWKEARTKSWCDTALGRFPLTPTHWQPLPTPPADREKTGETGALRPERRE